MLCPHVTEGAGDLCEVSYESANPNHEGSARMT